MSLFKVKKEMVYEAANNALNLVLRERNDLFEARVNKATKRFWLLKLFGAKPLSRDKAEKWVEDMTSTIPCIDYKIQGWRTESIAKELIAACDVTESGIVELDGEDAEFVKKWI